VEIEARRRNATGMHLSDHDLRQLDALSSEQGRILLGKALADLKAARERLGQNPTNSSRPPSTRAPWEASDADAGNAQETPASSPVAEAGETPAEEHSEGDSPRKRAKRPGGAGGTGLVLQQIKHIYLERRCDCGHWTRAEPGRCAEEADWRVALSEWHLAGATLVAFICALTQRMRLSRALVREFLSDWLGLELSTATINQCIHEAGRAVEPVVEAEIHEAVRDVELLYADETSWKEDGRLLWPWVFTCATATLFIVGRRSRAIVRQVLGETFRGWLMSDGYRVYRDMDWRLRCLAHLIRKAHGLEESFDAETQRFGTHILQVIETVIDAVYQARAAPPEGGLREAHAAMLNDLLAHCLRQADSRHEKTRALARELVNDWDTSWVVLDHPELPLTNNEAERALRHWVIARRIGMGTRTAQGTRAFALLASVIETGRKRAVSPWTYLAEVIRQRRKGLPAPPLPLPAT